MVRHWQRRGLPIDAFPFVLSIADLSRDNQPDSFTAHIQTIMSSFPPSSSQQGTKDHAPLLQSIPSADRAAQIGTKPANHQRPLRNCQLNRDKMADGTFPNIGGVCTKWCQFVQLIAERGACLSPRHAAAFVEKKKLTREDVVDVYRSAHFTLYLQYPSQLTQFVLLVSSIL
jgi:hypothetical protein